MTVEKTTKPYLKDLGDFEPPEDNFKHCPCCAAPIGLTINQLRWHYFNLWRSEEAFYIKWLRDSPSRRYWAGVERDKRNAQ